MLASWVASCLMATSLLAHWAEVQAQWAFAAAAAAAAAVGVFGRLVVAAEEWRHRS